MEYNRISGTIRNAEYTDKDAYEAYRNSKIYIEDINYYED